LDRQSEIPASGVPDGAGLSRRSRRRGAREHHRLSKGLFELDNGISALAHVLVEEGLQHHRIQVVSHSLLTTVVTTFGDNVSSGDSEVDNSVSRLVCEGAARSLDLAGH
jgi:hypothetical protein